MLNHRELYVLCQNKPAACCHVLPAELAHVCHVHGIPLLVDEAHGGHFAFHEGMPCSALAAGADLVMQSTHKVLSAMTQV